MTPWTPEEERLLFEKREQGLPIVILIDVLKKAGYDRNYSQIENKLYQKTKQEWKAKKRNRPPINAPPEPAPQKIQFHINKTTDEIIKIVALYDSHFPFNLPLDPILKFLKDFKPHVFIFGGDNWSLDCISHWNQNGFGNIGMDNVINTFNREALAFRTHVETILSSLPDSHIVYIIGNHEDWLEQFAFKFPQIEKPNLAKILYFDRPIEFIPRGGIFKIGKLHFAHGDQFGTQNPAKQAVERCHKSIVFGHHHTHKVWPEFSMVDDKDKHLGIQVPCFCGLAPEYGKGRPNSWQNGFFTACVRKTSGNFSPFVQQVSPRGTFITQAGIEYV